MDVPAQTLEIAAESVAIVDEHDATSTAVSACTGSAELTSGTGKFIGQ